MDLDAFRWASERLPKATEKATKAILHRHRAGVVCQYLHQGAARQIGQEFAEPLLKDDRPQMSGF
jgi:hypothetical protein